MRLLMLALLFALLTGCGYSNATANSAPALRPTPVAAPAPTFAIALGSAPAPAATPATTALLPTVVSAPITTYGYEVVRSYPHDAKAFTQGLVYVDGVLYEGTGLNGQSSLRRVNLETGAVEQIHNLPGQYFGEGIAVYSGTIVQLTWQNQLGFVYDQASFKELRQFSYISEGWGLTFDGKQLIMSDGTNTLRFLDPVTFQQTGTIQAVSPEGPVTQLNELEYIDGLIYANIWKADRVAIIDPANGRVQAWLDLAGLLSPAERASGVDVLNGIAYDPAGKRLFVTGKLWPKLFELKLVQR